MALAALAVSAVASVILTVALGSPGGPALILAAMAFQGSLVAFTVLWVGIRYRGWVPALGLRSARPARDVALGAWTGAALYLGIAYALGPVIVFVWRVVTGGPPDPIDQPVIPANPSPIEIALGLVQVVVGAPFSEEVFFRGFLFGSLRERVGFGLASAISAGVFALIHVDPLLVVLMFFVGLALAFLYDRRRSLVPCIAAHAVFNIIGYTLIVMDRL